MLAPVNTQQEARVGDFVVILNARLKQCEMRLLNGSAARKSLERMLSGNQNLSPENLYTVGGGLWDLVSYPDGKQGRQDVIQFFWHTVLYDLRRRFPRVNTTEQWVELGELLQISRVASGGKGDPRQAVWKSFLNRWIAPPIPSILESQIASALEPYRKNLVVKFHEISLSGFGGPGAQSEAEGKAELAKVYIDLDTKADPAEHLTKLARERGAISYQEINDVLPDSTTGGDIDNLFNKLRSRSVEMFDEDESLPSIHSQTKQIEHLQSTSNRVPVLETLALQTRLVLIGLPGSGKSTLLRFFSLCLVQSGLKPDADWLEHLKLWPKEETDLIPVFVELRQFAAGFQDKIPTVDGGQHLTKYILDQLKPSLLDECAGPLKKALAAGRAIVFLDGLDEVPDDDQLRRFVIDTVAAFAGGPFKASRIVVTCRPRSYDDPAWQLSGFEQAELAELDAPKIERYIEKFYSEVARRNPGFAGLKKDRIDKLKLAVQRDELHELAANPFMLTVMAWLHRFEELPKKRASILNRLVEMLLFKWEEIRQRDDPSPITPKLSELLKRHDLEVTSLRRVLCRLAFQARQASPPPSDGRQAQPRVSIPKSKLLADLAKLPDSAKHSQTTREHWAMDVIQVIDRRTGLLVPEGGDSYTMPYKLQEFLAGEHLTNRGELESVGLAFGLSPIPGVDSRYTYTFDRVAAQLVGENGYWEEVVKWAAAIQAHVFLGNIGDAPDLALKLCDTPAPSEMASLRRAVVAGEILWEVGIQEVKNTAHGPACLKKIRETLDAKMIAENLAPKQRAAAGIARAWLEDLPDIEWVTLPKGEFKLGETEQLVKITKPFQLSRYPITVAQYQAFVDDPDGYQQERFWNWNQEDSGMLKWWEKYKTVGPENYEPVFQTPNHPRVGVCWYEAAAFCRWLSKKTKHEIRLPHEAEWEWAARCITKDESGKPIKPKAHDFKFPWRSADEKELGQKCNCHQAAIGHTSAVGLFPAGDTLPLEKDQPGVADLSGNVWEWCQNQNDEKAKPSANEARVLRGGSWSVDGPAGLSCSYRSNNHPGDRNSDVGFRVVCASASAR